MDLLVKPVQSIGVQATENISSGNVTVVEGPIADRCVNAEMYPGRLRWNGLAMLPNGQKIFAQFVLIGMYKTGEYMFAIIVEGDKKIVKDAKVIFLSSVGGYVGNLEGGCFQIDTAKFKNDEQYQNEIIAQYGSRVGSRRQLIGFANSILKWHPCGTDEGDILTPYGDDFIKRIARINPGYGLLGKIILKNNITISASPATLWSIGMAILEGGFSKSQGWDYLSEIPNRAMMGEISGFTGALRLEVIRQLNEENVIAQQSRKQGEK